MDVRPKAQPTLILIPNPTKGFYILQEEADANDDGESDSGETVDSVDHANEVAVEQATVAPVAAPASSADTGKSDIKDVPSGVGANMIPEAPALPAQPEIKASSPTSSPSIQQVFSTGIHMLYFSLSLE